MNGSGKVEKVENENSAVDELFGAVDAENRDTQGESDELREMRERYEDMKRKYESARVEEGRVAKYDADLKAARKEIDELRARNRAADLESGLTDDERNEWPEKQLGSMTKLVSGALQKQREEFERRLGELKESFSAGRAVDNERAETDFKREVAKRFPAFLAGVQVGGALRNKWLEYRKFNGGSVNEAFTNRDIDSVAYHVRRFNAEYGVRDSDNTNANAALVPDPSNLGCGVSNVSYSQGKTYELDEYVKLQEECEQLFYSDKAAYAKLRDELEKAMAEKRVKGM